MPLKRGKGKAVRSANIGELVHSGYPPPQAAAIEYNREREKEGLRDPGYSRKKKKRAGY